MHPTPYFDRLSEAYAVVDGIPADQITLDIEQVSMADDTPSIGMNEGRYTPPTDWDALVLTPDLWLSLCPAYIDIVCPLLENREAYGIEVFWRIEGRITGRFEVAMAHLFNITHEEAEDLFGMRGDNEMDSRSDKQVFLDRVTEYLRSHGQEVTVGSGHVDQDEMLEHGISPSTDAAAAAETAAQAEAAAGGKSGIQTGFAALALESDAPGAEMLDTEAAATTVSPINQEQSVGQKEDGAARPQ